eukprot:scaffold4821_cov63-Phaeocystis_antarctica.AAC.1
MVFHAESSVGRGCLVPLLPPKARAPPDATQGVSCAISPRAPHGPHEPHPPKNHPRHARPPYTPSPPSQPRAVQHEGRVHALLEARGVRPRHLHVRSAQPLRALLVVGGPSSRLRRRVPRGKRGRLERRVRVVPRAQEGDERRAQLLGRERHAGVLLEHGLDQLGPLRRPQRLRGVGAGHEDVRLLLGARAGAVRGAQPRRQQCGGRRGH